MFKNINIDRLKCDPEAVNILTAACETVALTIEANKSDKPFFLAIGENHDCPAHYIHHMLIIEGLQKAGINFKVSRKNRDSIFLYAYLKS